MRIATKLLPAYAQHLIRELREGMFKYTLEELVAAEKKGLPNGETLYRTGLPTDDGFSYANFDTLAAAYKAQKRKRFSPRDVEVRFEPTNRVLINVAAFSFNGANGIELCREAQVDTWRGSDGESNYTRHVSFRGPCVASFGYGRNSSVTLYVPTGLSDEHRSFTEAHQSELGLQNSFVESPHRLFCRQTCKRIEGDPALLKVFIDAALEGRRFPYEEHHDVLKVAKANAAGKAA